MQRNTPLSIEAKAYGELKQRLQEAYDLEEDDEFLLGSLEGETDLKEMILRALREAQRKTAYAEGLSAIIADNRRRQQRLERGAESIRAAVAQAMADAGLPKIESADLTVSFRQAKPAPAVVDPEKLPEWAYTIQTTRHANRAAIKAAYQADPDNFECPGVVVTNGSDSIVVRKT